MSDWLPAPNQMRDAARLRPDAYPGTTMRQALGLITVLGLCAGLLPFFWNWFLAANIGAALPLARLAMAFDRGSGQAADFTLFLPHADVLVSTVQALAGLEPAVPGWTAAGISALGEWLNWPLSWMRIWLVYGLLVMAICKGLGATVTLQRFYGATGYAAVPLLLTGLSPIPCLGPLAAIAGAVWSFLVYARAVQSVTGLVQSRALLGVVLPVLVLLVVTAIVVGLFLFPILLLAF